MSQSQSFTSRKALHAALEGVMAQALASDFGIEVKTADATRLRQELNFARKALRERGDNSYDMLVFRTCPRDPEKYVWIIRRVGAARPTETFDEEE